MTHDLSKNAESLSALELLEWATAAYGDRLALASSFGAEDIVLIDLLSRVSGRPRVFTLDTRRLPPETYRLIETVRNRYSLELEVYFPNGQEVERMVHRHGLDLFYESIEKRKMCCRIRKVEPLKRALAALSAWITGLRREQSVHRSHFYKLEEDPEGRLKISPLADWSNQQVWQYIRDRDLPYNELHDQGYPTIGCAPCTRPVRAGEHPRAGRWWWEDSRKECGLHGPCV